MTMDCCISGESAANEMAITEHKDPTLPLPLQGSQMLVNNESGVPAQSSNAFQMVPLSHASAFYSWVLAKFFFC